jgi:AcrR family transcriptional regulator
LFTEAPPPGEPDSGTRCRDRVREWRGESILQAVAELLSETGCLSFTMDDGAQRVGISKGSLYLHTATRSGLVASLLDRWEADMPPAQDFANAPIEERTARACEALFHETDRGSGRAVPAFPCCLQTSRCPHQLVRAVGPHLSRARAIRERIGDARRSGPSAGRHGLGPHAPPRRQSRRSTGDRAALLGRLRGREPVETVTPLIDSWENATGAPEWVPLLAVGFNQG